MKRLQQLSERERYLVFGCVGLLIIYLIYTFIFAALFNAVALKKQELIDKRVNLEWMSHLPQGFGLQSVIGHKSETQLLAIIAKQLKQSSFKTYTYQLQHLSSNAIQLSYENVPYDTFIAWLWSFTEQNHVDIKQLTVEKTNLSGIVKLQVILLSLT